MTQHITFPRLHAIFLVFPSELLRQLGSRFHLSSVNRSLQFLQALLVPEPSSENSMVGLRRRLQIRLLCPRQRLILAEIFRLGRPALDARRPRPWHLPYFAHQNLAIALSRQRCCSHSGHQPTSWHSVASVVGGTLTTNYDVNESSSVLQKTRAQHRVYGQP